MVRSTSFYELPPEVLESVTERMGKPEGFTSAIHGDHAEVAGELRTSQGRAFVKGARLVPDQVGGGAQAWSLRNEAGVVSAVQPYAPKLLWQVETAGWLLVGFEYVVGRHADYSPNSPDLELVLAAIEDLSRLECPPSVRLRVEDRYLRLDERAQAFAGSRLVHCDMNPSNVLITPDGRARVVDWAFASRGAAWLDLAFMAPWMIDDGHAPMAAEARLRKSPLWTDTDPSHIGLFADLLDRTWMQRATGEGAATWIVNYARLVTTWRNGRLAQAGAEL